MAKKKTELDRLEAAASKAREASRCLFDERDAKRYAAVRKFTDQLDAELSAEYGERLKTLNLARYAAEQAVVAEKDRLANESPESPLPPGTKVVEWITTRSYGFEIPPDQWRLSGRVGVIEIWRSDSVAPSNMRSWSKPAIGCWIIRLLTKGKPSKLFIYPGRSQGLPKNWCEEGKRPKERKRR